MPGTKAKDSSFIALGEQQLSRFSYHWFRGIEVDKGSCNTLFNEVLILEENPLEVVRLQEQEDYVYSLLWIIQIAYWIFNINQYRENYYRLYSYHSYSYYKKELIKMPSPSVQNAQEISGFIISALGLAFVCRSEWFQRQIKPYLPAGLQKNHFSGSEEDDLLSESNPSSYLSIPNNFSLSILNQEENKVDIESSTSDDFLVTEDMLSSLMVLNIRAQSGIYYSFSSLKRAYNQRLRETHPDKTRRDSKEEFVAVMDAYKKILSLVPERSSLFEMIQKELHAWKVFRQDISEYNKRVEVYFKDVDQFIESVHELKESVGDFKESVDEFKDLTNKYIKSASEFIEGVNEFGKLVTDGREKTAQQLEEIGEINRLLDAWDAEQAACSSDTYALKNRTSFFASNMKHPEKKKGPEENTVHSTGLPFFSNTNEAQIEAELAENTVYQSSA